MQLLRGIFLAIALYTCLILAAPAPAPAPRTLDLNELLKSQEFKDLALKRNEECAKNPNGTECAKAVAALNHIMKPFDSDTTQNNFFDELLSAISSEPRHRTINDLFKTKLFKDLYIQL